MSKAATMATEETQENTNKKLIEYCWNKERFEAPSPFIPKVIQGPVRKKQNKEYAEAMANYLNHQDWSKFCTFTTGYTLTLPGARRLMERVYSNFSTSLFTGNHSYFFWVAEAFECKAGYHTHGLLYYDKMFESPYLFSDLNEHYQVASGSRSSFYELDKNNINKSITEKNNSYLQNIINTGIQQKRDYRVSFNRYDLHRGAAKYCAKYLLKRYADYDLFFSRGFDTYEKEDFTFQPVPELLQERKYKYNCNRHFARV